MAGSRLALASSCTLDAQALRVREQEFRSLFSRELLDFERIDAQTARLGLGAACEPELRDVLAREQRCCSFFDFGLEATRHRVVLTVRVPTGYEAALTALLDLAGA